LNFTCGLPAGNDAATNTEANADSPTGLNDPYGGTTYTPGPSPNAGGMGIAGLNRLRTKRETMTVVDSFWTSDLWALLWAVVGGLMVWVL